MSSASPDCGRVFINDPIVIRETEQTLDLP